MLRMHVKSGENQASAATNQSCVRPKLHTKQCFLIRFVLRYGLRKDAEDFNCGTRATVYGNFKSL